MWQSCTGGSGSGGAAPGSGQILCCCALNKTLALRSHCHRHTTSTALNTTMSLAQACAMLPEHAWTEVLKHSSDAGLATLLAVGDKTIASGGCTGAQSGCRPSQCCMRCRRRHTTRLTGAPMRAMPAFDRAPCLPRCPAAWQAVQHEWAAQHKPSTLVDHWAASGNTQALRGMLAAGQWHASWLNQALVKACERGHSDCVHALITAGADQLDFALAVAAGKGHLQAVQR
jgi:hypothetical protein